MSIGVLAKCLLKNISIHYACTCIYYVYMRYDTLHPLVLVYLSINVCTEKKTEGVKDCAETFVRQS